MGLFRKKKEKTEEGKTYDWIKPGGRVKIVGISGTDRIRKRLLDMGIIPGIEMEILRIAPLGDPVEFIVRGTRISLRKEEYKFIMVEEIKGE